MRLDNYTRKTLSVQITCNYQYGKGERELGICAFLIKILEYVQLMKLLSIILMR